GFGLFVRDIDDRDRVHVAQRGVEEFLVGGERQACGGCAGDGPGDIRTEKNCRKHLILRRVDEGNGVAVSVRDEKPILFLVQQQCDRVRAGLQLGELLDVGGVGGVEDVDGAVALAGDVQL